MPIPVKIKWNGQVFDVELDQTQSLEVFKNQIFSLTMVHPDRQKVVRSGVQLKQDADLQKVKSGATLMLMGTVGELPKAPEQKTVFLEDMTDTQLAEAVFFL